MTTPTKLWYLENLQVLHTLTRADVEHLHGRLLMQTFAKGEAIYFDGDRSDSLFILKTGQVKITHRSAAGQEVILARLGPGDLFGELTLSESGQRYEEAVALDETLVCRVEVSDFNGLLAANHEFSLEVNKLVRQRLKKVQSRLSDLVFKSAEQRVRDPLRELAQVHGKRVANDPNQVVSCASPTTTWRAWPPPATSHQTVTTLLNSLEREGLLLHNRRHLFIKRLNQL
ncbi:Crp/Fnr family transcriptional regulator [Hymenobacter ginsengisoli]|uniref:Crp/Fnr family transcriptional regulator n=1 Tax=Hymenobacter ginsengisoli TaxID=1051626 RepID=A0ABP8QN50_9BACT|nr:MULTISPECIES: Crp/Fnr family transcriptional regulator [unclassified Hymenobacter]MBO2033948.1 Crp/Fnr family transcriptional regulator [Hymenobacter sp. BT559]